jgi:hypothetical protein
MTTTPPIIDLVAAEKEEVTWSDRPYLMAYEGDDDRLWWMYIFMGTHTHRTLLFDFKSVANPRDIHRRVRKYPDIGRVFGAQYDRTSTPEEDAYATNSGIAGRWCVYPKRLALSGTDVDPKSIVRVCQHFVVRE